jgi:hypothetical protein
MNTPFYREFGLLKSWVMDHVICFVKTVPSQSLVKLNVFNYFEKKNLGKVTLNKKQLNLTMK